MEKHRNGKGSVERPTDRQKYEENYDRIFRRQKEKTYTNESQWRAYMLGLTKGANNEQGTK